MISIPKSSPIRIQGDLYSQAYGVPIEIGDYVLDLSNGTYGVCVLIESDGRIAVKDGWVTEGRILASQCVKLIPLSLNQ